MTIRQEEPASQIRRLPLEQISESLFQLRIPRPGLEEKMRRSLEVHGQFTPVTVWSKEGHYELVDGFKRLHAACRIPGWAELTVRVLAQDPITAKGAMLTLNQLGAGLSVMEEAWVIQSLVREEHLSQQKVGALLGKDRSWVSRRLSLVERLIDAAQEEMRLGLVSPTVARMLAGVPRGTQEKLLLVLRREILTSRQVATLVGLLATASPASQEELLAHPHEALSRLPVAGIPDPPRDPRLGCVAADLSGQILLVLNLSCRLGTRLDRTEFLSLKATERSILERSLHNLWRELVTLQRTMRSKLCPASATPTATAGPNSVRSSPAEPTSKISSFTCTA